MSSEEKSIPVLMLGGHSATRDSEPGRRGSFGRTSSASSSIRRRSFSLSGVLPSQIDDNIESESVSEAGDIGDRALHSNRHSRSGSLCFSFDHVSENGVVIPIPEDTLSHSYGHFSHDPAAMNPVSPISPLPEELLSPISTDAMVQAENKMQNDKKEMPKLLEYSSCLTHLAVFGILGVLTRYLLQKLFGPGIAGVTSDESILYLDLPSNMVGSFLMGWFGIVFKGDISRVSDFLAIGLSTGFLGSLTTFSGWNQKMLELSVDGRWVLCILGFLIGLFLVAYSIIFGVETAKGFRRLLEKRIANQECGIHSSSRNWRVDSCERHMAVMVVCMLILGLLWSVSGVLLREKFSSDSDEAHLWFGCIVGPLGVWTRWFLARLNGRGLGKAGYLKWIPFGTLIANVSAACIMAALSTIQKASSQYREKSSPGDLVGVYRGDSYTTHETDDDIESEIVSEAGDIGDRALHSNRPSEHGSPRLSFCHGSENNRVAPPISLPRNMSFQPFSPASPLPKELASPTLVEAGKRQQIEDKTLNKKEELPKVLEYSSCLTHLAVFGILGVLTRYLLQKLFRPGAAGVTSNLSILYPDLPSNMVCLSVCLSLSLSNTIYYLSIAFYAIEKVEGAHHVVSSA